MQPTLYNTEELLEIFSFQQLIYYCILKYIKKKWHHEILVEIYEKIILFITAEVKKLHRSYFNVKKL